jgi:hypothetical protein
VSVLLFLLAVLAWILLAAVGLALLVIAFPVHLRGRGAVHDGEPSGAVRVAWAFGLLAGELTPAGLAFRVAGAPVYRAGFRELLRRRKEAPERAEKDEDEEDHGREARQKGRGKLSATLENRRILLAILKRFARALHLRLRVRGRVGLADPADTAVLAGLLPSLGQVPGVELDVELDWLDETLEGEVVGSARVWVPELLWVAALLLLRREHRAAVRALAG